MFFVLAAVGVRGPTPWLAFACSPHFFVFAGGAKTGFARKNGRISSAEGVVRRVPSNHKNSEFIY
jgi:hypothetical protein